MHLKFILTIMVFLICSCSSNSQPADIDENDKDLFNHLQKKTIQQPTEDLVAILVKEMAEKKLILLGESTHGTSEYYSNRYLISRALVENHGFSFIAVEGDWTAIYKLNLFVRGISQMSDAREIMKKFDRWPEWMWANEQFLELVNWLRKFNEGKGFDEQVGLYGMDVYGQWSALEQLHNSLLNSTADYASEAVDLLNCFLAYSGDEWSYAAAVVRGTGPSCEEELGELWSLFNSQYGGIAINEQNYEAFNLSQKAKILKNSEAHFRMSPVDRAGSWNTRVLHFWNTVQRLLEYYGPDSKGIGWAHNTHVGDARYNIMGNQGQTNIGQLSREFLGDESVFILGFGTYHGRVNAGGAWGETMQIMEIPPAVRGSYEQILNEVEGDEFVLIFENEDRMFPSLLQARGNRAIGVTYNPLQDRGNYVPTLLAHRYDAFWFIKETKPLTPILK